MSAGFEGMYLETRVEGGFACCSAAGQMPVQDLRINIQTKDQRYTGYQREAKEATERKSPGLRQPLRLTSARRAPGGVDVCPLCPGAKPTGKSRWLPGSIRGPPTMSKAGLFIRSYKCVVSHVQLHMRDDVLSAAGMAQFPSF